LGKSNRIKIGLLNYFLCIIICMTLKRGDFMKDSKKDKLVTFRLPEVLIKKIDKFAEKLELTYVDPSIRNKGFRSVAIRLIIEDTMLRFFGPKDNKDELFSPHYNEMSKIIPILKNIKLREKLENMPDDMKTDKINEWILKNIIFGEQIK